MASWVMARGLKVMPTQRVEWPFSLPPTARPLRAILRSRLLYPSHLPAAPPAHPPTHQRITRHIKGHINHTITYPLTRSPAHPHTQHPAATSHSHPHAPHTSSLSLSRKASGGCSRRCTPTRPDPSSQRPPSPSPAMATSGLGKRGNHSLGRGRSAVSTPQLPAAGVVTSHACARLPAARTSGSGSCR